MNFSSLDRKARVRGVEKTGSTLPRILQKRSIASWALGVEGYRTTVQFLKNVFEKVNNNATLYKAGPS